jgi:hypothetical protein
MRSCIEWKFTAEFEYNKRQVPCKLYGNGQKVIYVQNFFNEINIYKLGCLKNIISGFRRKVYYGMAEVLFTAYAEYWRQSFFFLCSEQTSAYRLLLLFNLFYRNNSSCFRPRPLISNLFHCVEFITGEVCCSFLINVIEYSFLTPITA